ncbi:MAG: HAMP domain-containing histidine kinase [Candidatus Gastranaerophilales bacterium]|nr:HAMP domain-containing histidine kinase [Candidatus Gastranaerophilales bacterium]
MEVMLAVLGIGLVVLCVFYLRLRKEIFFLCGQLEEIERGSHMEITVNCRQKPLLALCRRLNQVLSSRDADRILYERAELQLKQNIAGLAHDIRTPLTGASGYVQMAGECEEKGRRERYLRAAERRLAELGDMLEEMFLYTKLISEDFELSVAKIPVFPLLSDCLLGLYDCFEEKGVTPKVEFESEELSILADEEALRRIFLNLIQNALIHGEGGLSITQKGSNLIFENALSEDSHPDTELLFDRFYKADSARRKGSSGLGLFIVRELAEKMGGKVKAEVNEGTFRIILSVLQPDL